MSTFLMTEVFCIRDTYSTYSYPVVKDVNNSNFTFPSAVSTTCSTQLPNMVFLFPNSHISLYICDIKRPAAEFWRNQVCETKTDFVAKTNDWFCNAINCSYTPPFNTIAPNSFSDTHHALDSHFLFCEWCLKKIVSRYSFWVGQQDEPLNPCSRRSKCSFWSFFECAYLKHLRYSVFHLR